MSDNGGILMYQPTQTMQSMRGFTLVELMISLVLGLIITAAAMQIYVTNFKTTTIQRSASEMQDASVFGLQLLEYHLRLANLGTADTKVTDSTRGGGVVLTGYNLGVFKENADGTTTDAFSNVGYLTRRAGDTQGGTNGWTGKSNTNVASDQLTIQYRNITSSNIVDCESANVAPNEVAIERYFLREPTNTSGLNQGMLVLACDAGRLKVVDGKVAGIDDTATGSKVFGQKGEEFITGVDQFKVLLGTQGINPNATSDLVTSEGTTVYMPSSAYMKMDPAKYPAKPPIISVKVAMIVKGSTPVVTDKPNEKFTIFGEEQTVNSTYKQTRTTYETTAALRNARVIQVDTSIPLN